MTARAGTRLPKGGITIEEIRIEDVPAVLRDAAGEDFPIVLALNLGPDGAVFSPPLDLSALIQTPMDASGFEAAAKTVEDGEAVSLPVSSEPADGGRLRVDVEVAHFSIVVVQMKPRSGPYPDRASRVAQARLVSLDGVRVLPPNRNYVFTSSELLDGALTTELDGATFSGVSGIDDFCRLLATRHLEETGHQIPGTDFVALINAVSEPQSEVLGPDRRLLLENLEGALFVPPTAEEYDEIEAGRRSFTDQEIQFRDRALNAGRLSGPASRDISNDELGGKHVEPIVVWTGASPTDSEQDWTTSGPDCGVELSPWTSSNGEGGVGSPLDPEAWNQVDTQPCASRNAIYCVALRDELLVPAGINFILPPSGPPGPFDDPEPPPDEPPPDVVTPEDLLHCVPGGRPLESRRVPADLIAASTATSLEDGQLRVPVSFSGFSEGGERPSSGSASICDTPSENFVISARAFVDPPLNPPHTLEFLGQFSAPVLFDLGTPTAACPVVPVPGSGRLGGGGAGRGNTSDGSVGLTLDPGGLTGIISLAGPSGATTLALEVTVTQDGSGEAGRQVDRFTCGTPPPPPEPEPMDCVPGEVLRQETRVEQMEFKRIGVDDLFVSKLGGTRLIPLEEARELVGGLRSSIASAFSAGAISMHVSAGLRGLVDTPFRGSRAKRALLDSVTSIVVTDPQQAYLGFQAAAADAVLAEFSRILPQIQGGWIDADITFGRFYRRQVTLDIETQLTFVCDPDGSLPDKPVEGDVAVLNVDIGPCEFTSTEGGTVKIELPQPVPISNNVARAMRSAISQALAIAPSRIRVLAGREIGACM